MKFYQFMLWYLKALPSINKRRYSVLCPGTEDERYARTCRFRFTQDVDLIANARGRGEWSVLLDQFRQRGFSESMEDDVICRMRLGLLKIDIMPDDASILGFSNRWYTDAIANAQICSLNKKLKIRILTAEYFVATKLEAWLGRGNNDPLSSHDLEVRSYIVAPFRILLDHPDFEYAVQGNVRDADHINRLVPGNGNKNIGGLSFASFLVAQGLTGISNRWFSSHDCWRWEKYD